MPSVLDLILAEAKSPTSDLDNCRKCMRLLQFLVKKHNIIPPSLFVQDNICTLVNLDPETPDSILFAVEPSKIPLVLDLLLAEAKKSKLNHEYCRKCIKWLRLLVNRHFALPPSLFLQEITMSSLRIAAVGGYSVSIYIYILTYSTSHHKLI
ncbi:hypothetical protein L218DRAFT_668774 [Marasmius fiardii PR-910]|nr:hypothetical protein L218DRAFT_668774 [Marasmius fiardii PR-910]